MCGNMNYNQNFTTVLSIGDDIFRPLVESEAELLNHCVTIVVGEDRVVEQSIMPGSTHCAKIFLESWQILLNSKWNQVEHFALNGNLEFLYFVFPSLGPEVVKMINFCLESFHKLL